MFLFTTDEREVCGILYNSPNKGLDKIAVANLKKEAKSITQPLTLIINECLSAGIFPSPLKKVKVVPIYKRKGDIQNKTSYRPISLVLSVSKVCEKIITRL